MGKENFDIQKQFTKAIDEYTDRSSETTSQDGPKDIMTLQKIGIQKMFQIFRTSVQDGLLNTQVEQNAQKYGKNEYQKRKRKTFCQILMEAICNQLLIILIIAAVVSVVASYFSKKDQDIFWVSGVSIMIAVMVCVLVSTISNYKKQKQFDELDQITQSTYNIQILREGNKQQIHRTQIVPGDMIFVQNGMEVPADCILVKAVHVIVNESAITGETNQIYKNTLKKCVQQKMDPNGPTPLMISGSSIVSGEGLMMAVVVGKQSKAGQNFELLFQKQAADQQNQTPLERQLQRLTIIIGRIGVGSAIFIFIVLVIRLLIDELPKGHFYFNQQIQKFIQYLIIAVTVIVVAIPQGLPLAVTLTLAYSMKAMYDDKILVRKLQSCQTMGAARYLCSDKTGTITQNKMDVMYIINMKSIPVSEFVRENMHQKYYQKIKHAIFHNTSSVAEPQKGAQTEIALLKLCRTLTGQNEQQQRNKIGQRGYLKRLPFDSSRKRMTTAMMIKQQCFLFMNGASEQILQACNQIQDIQSNQIIKLTAELKYRLTTQLQNMPRKGYRTVSIAYKKVNSYQISNEPYNRQNDVVEQIQKSEFILLGIFCIQDPPRQQSKQAIQSCKKAGIRVIMVTGDNKITAQNISQQVGIIDGGRGRDKIVQASQFMKQLQQKGLLKEQIADVDKQGNPIDESDEQSSKKMKKIHLQTQEQQRLFEQLIQDLVVMARSKPQHKYILVDGINKLGHVVGVTGDGANDAPALMRADIGLAMGITGTQVSKNASDIIILDDNFKSIVRAVVWGRNVYTSLRKFLQFQFTANFMAVALVLVSASLLRQSALTSMQMLWINLVMNSMAALALATQPPNSQQLLNQQPNSPDQKLITNTMLKHIIGHSLFQLTILLILVFVGPLFIPEFYDEFDQYLEQDYHKYYHGGSTVVDGSFYDLSGRDNYIQYFNKYHVYSRHYTVIFNTFVFLQVFNFICCRRIKDQFNILSHLCSSKIFWIVLVCIVGGQIMVITFGGRIFQIYKFRGLTIVQWLICIGIGSLSIPMSLFLRLLPCCKPDDSVYVKRQSQRTRKMKDKGQAKKKQGDLYVKPIKKYSKLNPMDYVRKIRARRAMRKQAKGQAKRANAVANSYQ